MEIGDRETIHIDDLTSQGSGVGRGADGAAVFVRGALPGDKVEYELKQKKKKYRVGELLEIKEASPDRVESFCPYSCGGCPFSELRYERQVEQKRKQIINDLEHIGGIKDPVVKDPVSMESPFHYRNKVKLEVEWQGGDEWSEGSQPAIGFYQRGSHDVIDCPLCRVQTAPVTAVASSLRTFMMQNHISTFDQREKKGVLKDVVVRTAFSTGEVMVVFDIGEDSIPDADKLIDMMDAQIRRVEDPDGKNWILESVYTVNPKGIPMLLAGKPTIIEMMGEVKFEMSPTSFYQVNPVQTVKLYDKVMEYAGLSEGDSVLDLYCGVGSIGLYMSSLLGGKISVLGIESSKSAVLDANRNAGINGIVNARFIQGNVEDVLPELVEKQDEEVDEVGSNEWFARRAVKDARVAVLDPPRAGAGKKLLDAVIKAGPERIVYVSCDPATLSRDLKHLTANGYSFIEATPVDMFPHTGHVECVVLMSKANT